MRELHADIRYPDCWLSPDGSFYNGDAHENRAVEILSLLYGIEDDDAASVLEDLGWVRLTRSLMWDVRQHSGYWNDKELPQAQLNSLWDWCKYHGKQFPYTD